jgi:FAD/FMN-containing dehydrogenase
MDKVEALRAQFEAIVGAAHVWGREHDLAHYNNDNRGLYFGDAALVIRPGSTQEASAVLALAYANDIAIVPQSGHTGHAAGGVPAEGQIVVTTERMTNLRSIDVDNNAMTVDAGMILEQLHAIADQHDRLYPVSLAAKGSCRIGGNVATNAGGTAVLAYGNTRDNILGLEVVLPDGRIWDGLRALRKDNSGYDLKQLFIGSEGTLGLVTGVVVKLWPKPKGQQVAFVALDSPEQALALLTQLKGALGPGLTAFELMPRLPLAFTLAYQDSLRDPFAEPYPWYALVEISNGQCEETAREQAERALGSALEEGRALDVALAQSDAQRAALWALRETMPSAQKPQGWSIKHDIALPVHLIPAFFEQADALVYAALPGARICGFGHMGDGNIHYNISQPEGAGPELFAPKRQEINAKIHALVSALGGSVSAEHGIGLAKKALLAEVKSPVELAMMRAVKQALDPKGLMNPGKIFD